MTDQLLKKSVMQECRARAQQIYDGGRYQVGDAVLLSESADEIERLTRCLSEASIPAGWKLVPVEPTKEMLDAVKAWPAHWNRDDPEWGQRQVAAFEADRMAATSSYQLMLDAAPEAPK